jgi:4-diphosphocytidyl-2-C-methyl-D-erythritol kinase
VSEEQTIFAPCKVNLYLEIRGLRDDGYHELLTLFHPLAEPADTLHISPAPEGAGLEFSCGDPDLEGPNNTVVKAYRAFSEAAGAAPDIRLRLDKSIPSGAGLGGGSSDAAALLMHLNDGLGHPLEPSELQQVAAGVGADVPFFLYGEPAWAEGIGDRLEPAEIDLSGMHSLLACPDLRVSTAEAYRLWDGLKREEHSLTGPVRDIKKVNFFSVWMRNSFEAAVFPAYPEIRNLKERLLAAGASGAVMTGSGAAVFAIYRERRAAEQAASRLAKSGVRAYVNAM